MKKLKNVLAVLVTLIAAAVIIGSVFAITEDLARSEVYNIAISLIVVLLCVVSIVSFIVLGRFEKKK